MIKTLKPSSLRAAIPRLAELLVDAVEAGAGVGFLPPFSQGEAEKFWQQSGLGVRIEQGNTTLFVAQIEGIIAGMILLHRVPMPNQPKRGEIAKLLVHQNYQHQTLGQQLLKAAMQQAKATGLTLLTLDCVAHGRVEQFYRQAGFQCAGYIPRYALSGYDRHQDDVAIMYLECGEDLACGDERGAVEAGG